MSLDTQSVPFNGVHSIGSEYQTEAKAVERPDMVLRLPGYTAAETKRRLLRFWAERRLVLFRNKLTVRVPWHVVRIWV